MYCKINRDILQYMITAAIQQHKIERDRTLAAQTIPRELTGILTAAKDLTCAQLTVLTGNETWQNHP